MQLVPVVEKMPLGKVHKATEKHTKGAGRKKNSPEGGGRKGMQLDTSVMFAKW